MIILWGFFLKNFFILFFTFFYFLLFLFYLIGSDGPPWISYTNHGINWGNRVPVSETIESSAIKHEAMDNLIMKKIPVLERR